jgi:plasmid maintenance system antidote protein VapI
MDADRCFGTAQHLQVICIITKAAESLGVTRKTFSMLLNGKSGISPEMVL